MSFTQNEPPEDYRLLVPRDWFRIDLTHERWRPALKKFVDKHATRKGMPSHTKPDLWVTLRNTAEAGLSHGSLEFFLKADGLSQSTTPATLLISLLPLPGDLWVGADEWAEKLRRTRRGDIEATDELRAGRAVRIATKSSFDYYVEMPGRVGYLVLGFSIPASGVDSPMGELCEAIARSLRWV